MPDDDLIAALQRRVADAPPAAEPSRGMGIVIGSVELTLPIEPQWPQPPPRRPPCDDEVVDATEAALGVTLPSLLRRLYTEVGDGGFGPGDGIVGAAEVVELHNSYAVELAVEQEMGDWPAGLVPLCELD